MSATAARTPPTVSVRPGRPRRWTHGAEVDDEGADVVVAGEVDHVVVVLSGVIVVDGGTVVVVDDVVVDVVAMVVVVVVPPVSIHRASRAISATMKLLRAR